MTDEQGEIIIYQTNDGKNKIDVKLEGETVWLTQAQLVELYQSSKSNVSEHIKHIYEEGELEKVQLFGISEQFKKKEIERFPEMSNTIIWI